MPFAVVRNDITQMRVDAIVASAKPSLLGGGGVDGAIRRAAGPRLALECLGLGGLKVGEAKRTRGYRLPCKYVIHTVGPIWHGGANQENIDLKDCYWHSLQLAEKNEIRSIAFPSIATGVYGYPVRKAAEVAVRTVSMYVNKNPDKMDKILFVLFDSRTKEAYDEALKDI